MLFDLSWIVCMVVGVSCGERFSEFVDSVEWFEWYVLRCMLASKGCFFHCVLSLGGELVWWE